MELLGVLEKKIEHLVTIVKELRLEKSSLEATVVTLQQQVETLEASLLKNHEVVNKDKATAQQLVDSLIADIDSLLAEEKQ